MSKLNKLIVLTSQIILFSTLVNCYPADYREDTVLPFSVSPGNVNLEKYDWSKHPKFGPVQPPQQNNPQRTPFHPGNNDDLDNLKSHNYIIRTKRLSSPPQPLGHVHGRRQGNMEHYNQHHNYLNTLETMYQQHHHIHG